MHGTCEGDRFHLLVAAIAAVVSDANVVLVDWSAASRASSVPMFVAWRIDSIADEASQDLCDLGFQGEQATLIGESFGNYLNARIASDFGQVDRLIAMNPASQLGGYPVPDLRRCSRVSWSFHTDSIFDTSVTLAHATILLETSDDATDIEKHTCGIERLTERLVQCDLEWLIADRVLPDNSTQEYRVLARLDGKLVETKSPKHYVSPQEEVADDEQSNSTPAT
jgi:pimeloyl-ACP methyl ester carboxylesterase